jgi:hypothetical protein
MESNRNGFAAKELPLTIKDAPDIGVHSGNFLNSAIPSTSALSLEITASRQFTSWLAEQNLSLAFTTYQAGKVFLLGCNRRDSCRYSSAPLSAAWGCMQRVQLST